MNIVYKSLISITIIISMLISGIAIASAKPGPTPTPTTPVTSGIYSKTINGNFILPAQCCWQPLTNFTFNMPTDGYASIESSGFITVFNLAGVQMRMDNSFLSGTDTTYRIYTSNNNNTINLYGYSPTTGFQTTKTYFLTQGNHTVYLFGLTSSYLNIGNTYFSGISFTAIVNQNGGIQEINCPNYTCN